jgi:hypothetical protein
MEGKESKGETKERKLDRQLKPQQRCPCWEHLQEVKWELPWELPWEGRTRVKKKYWALGNTLSDPSHFDLCNFSA